jgi:hypothetical protein
MSPEMEALRRETATDLVIDVAEPDHWSTGWTLEDTAMVAAIATCFLSALYLLFLLGGGL